MRYIVEAKSTGEDVLKDFVAGRSDLEIVNSYDPIENLTEKVEKLGLGLREFKQSGVNWRVFNYYLRGRGISQSMIDTVMRGVDDFFKEVGLK